MIFKESSESGLSTIGFVTILATISISMIGAATFAIKDAEAKVDRSVEFDIKNIAAHVNNRIASEQPNEKTLINNTYIGTDDLGVPISDVNPLSKGTTMTADGTPQGFCIFASNPGGDQSAETHFVYASLSGGFRILADGQYCNQGEVQTLVSDQ